MSAVLMCDSCGNLFSVNETGWKEYTETISSIESNPYNVGKRQQHMGPCCSFQGGTTRPQIRPVPQDAKPELKS